MLLDLWSGPLLVETFRIPSIDSEDSSKIPEGVLATGSSLIPLCFSFLFFVLSFLFALHTLEATRLPMRHSGA